MSSAITRSATCRGRRRGGGSDEEEEEEEAGEEEEEEEADQEEEGGNGTDDVPSRDEEEVSMGRAKPLQDLTEPDAVLSAFRDRFGIDENATLQPAAPLVTLEARHNSDLVRPKPVRTPALARGGGE